MFIARGSIHHKIIEDIRFLYYSFLDKEACNKASNEKKYKLISSIKRYFEVENVALFPYARTSLFALLKGLQLEKGSEILMTPFTIGPMVDVIENLGFKPIFVDINLEDFGPDYDDLTKKISTKPSCFLLTYLFGYVPNIEYITNLCKQYNVPLIEDISQNIGARYKGTLLGKFGLASFYSASLTKYVDGYNGAFSIINSKSLYKKVDQFSQKLIQPRSSRIRGIIFKTTIWNFALNRFFFNFITFPLLYFLKIISRNKFEKLLGASIKFKPDKILPQYYFEDISNIQCEAIIRYLTGLDALLNERRRLALYVIQVIKDFDIDIKSIKEFSEKKDLTFWQYTLMVKDTQVSRNILFKKGIETGTTKLPNLSKIYSKDLTNAEKLKKETIFLPIHKYLSKKDYKNILEILKERNLLQ